MTTNYRTEDLGGGVSACVSSSHTFGTDSLLLSWFASPKKKDMACDLCSGCGIVPLLWFRDGNGPRTAHAVEIQEDAVSLMEQSASLSRLEGFIPVRADLKEWSRTVPAGSFDLVTCNPPYRAAGSGVLSRSKADQTARHEIECSLEDVTAAAGRLLRYGGRFCICHMPERLVDVFQMMRANKIEPKRMRLCQARQGKAPWLVLVEGKLGSKPFLQVEEPLILESDGVRGFLYGKKCVEGSLREWGSAPNPA